MKLCKQLFRSTVFIGGTPCIFLVVGILVDERTLVRHAQQRIIRFCAKQFSTGVKKCQGKLADCQIESATPFQNQSMKCSMRFLSLEFPFWDALCIARFLLVG